MKKLLIVSIAFVLILVGCKSKNTPQDKIDAFVQKYLYAIRDAVDKKQGTIKDVYDNYLSDEMKKSVTLEQYTDYVTQRYKGKIANKLRASFAKIVKDKATGKILEATARTSNMGRMAAAMNQDSSLIYKIRVVPFNNTWKVEQTDLMARFQEETAKKKRLDELLATYKGLIKLEGVSARKIPERKGWAEITGTILNGSDDLNLVKVGVKVKFKDSNGDTIWIAKFYPVVNMRYEGLSSSVLPDEAKVFKTKIKDIPDTWDVSQPLVFSFYLIDGEEMNKQELAKERKKREKLKKLIQETKKADEEARKQQNELWKKEKALKAKIKAMKNKVKK